jgi:hypothetical protein
MINKIELDKVKVASYLKLDTFTEEINKNFETLATAIEGVNIEGVVTIPGPQGDKGEQGERGLRGEQGPAGQDGKDGKDGVHGQDGLPGIDGKDGKDGLPGAQGPKGETGAQGVQGVPGKDGRDGINGAPGKDGAQGPAGPQGVAGPAGPQGLGLPGYKGVRVDDGVEVTIDTIVVKLNTASPRSLQFKLTTGTMNVNISGIIYWTTNGVGNVGSNYFQGKTLTTTWQQPFGWDFPWANDYAQYMLQDLTNGRFYRITLSIGPGYKGNFIVMERLV